MIVLAVPSCVVLTLRGGMGHLDTHTPLALPPFYSHQMSSRIKGRIRRVPLHTHTRRLVGLKDGKVDGERLGVGVGLHARTAQRP